MFMTDEEKKDYKDGKKFFSKEALKVVSVIVIICFVVGALGVGYTLTIGKMQKDADREVFERNKSYVHGMVEDLARYKMQYSVSSDDTEKKAIVVFINENYANFDGKLIENDSLREFFYDVMEGRLQ